MASIIPGFEYDIFISYRQKDNNYDGWVTEFVQNLKRELEATFKEEISVYFDINPHDGLLETHDVHASLKDKLKCLVFIPIMSRTYCDPKSFAWEHEFKAFMEQASGDKFGLKVVLPGGNVATRVLPVRIHELDITDTRLCEEVLGGVLRGIDFIYKSPGVNRPLRANEDHPKDNLNKTYYRDQINKIANAINDIIRSIGKVQPGHEGNTVRITDKARIAGKWKLPAGSAFLNKHSKGKLLILLPVFIFLFGAYFVYRSIHLNNTERSIAIIPLRNVNKENSLVNDGDGFIEAVNDKLNIVKRLIVTPRISTLQYRETEKSLDIIRKELKINYLIDGNIRWEDNKINIWIELSAAKDNKVLWSGKYVWDKNQIPLITQEIVRMVADNLNINLTPGEIKLIESEPTNNAEANLNFISANVISRDAWIYYNYGNRLLDSTSFTSAIQKYDKAIAEDSLFALAYARRAIASSWGYFVGQLDSTYIGKCKKDIDKAMALDKNLTDVQIAMGFYYYYCKNEFENALFHFNEAVKKDPGNYQPLFYMSLVYRKMGKWKESQSLISRVVQFSPREALFLTNIGLSYSYLHNYDSALIYHQKAIDIMPEWPASYENKIEAIILKNGMVPEARIVLDEAIKRTGDNLTENRIVLDIYDGKYTNALSLAKRSNPGDFKNEGERYLYLARISTLLNNRGSGISYYDSAIVALSKYLTKDQDNQKIYGSIGIAYAGRGDKVRAIEAGDKAIRLAGENKMDESDMKLNLAKIYTMTGNFDEALKSIDYLLNNPSGLSVKLLPIDPVWKPLQNLPEYIAIIKKYSKR